MDAVVLSIRFQDEVSVSKILGKKRVEISYYYDRLFSIGCCAGRKVLSVYQMLLLLLMMYCITQSVTLKQRERSIELVVVSIFVNGLATHSKSQRIIFDKY